MIAAAAAAAVGASSFEMRNSVLVRVRWRANRADADARATFWGVEHARSLVSLAVVGLSHRHRRR